MAAKTYLIIKRLVPLRIFVRIVAGYTTQSRIRRIVPFAGEDAIRLETNT